MIKDVTFPLILSAAPYIFSRSSFLLIHYSNNKINNTFSNFKLFYSYFYYLFSSQIKNISC